MRKKLLLIAVMLLSLASAMGQRQQVTLPANGDWPETLSDSVMLIGPKQEALTEKQVYFNPPYLLVYPGKEDLKQQMIRACVCDCDTMKPNRRIGVFSVAKDKQVSFSQGNLQYLPAANLWKFADKQYEYLGNSNKYISSTYRNWVDLFGWSADNTTAPFGVSTSTNAADYAGDFVDWGTNTICGDAPGIWRTLSVDEWDYLFKKRTNAAQLYSKGSIEGTRGMIVLPDNWALPEGVQFTVDTANLTMDLDLNAYSYAEWQKMEGAGAVFLCVTGRRDGKEVRSLQEYGCYWSNTVTNNKARHLYFNYDTELFLPSHSGEKHLYARSVRLVHDTIVPKPEPEYVDLGLSVKWATFNVGATSPEDYGDYFAWGETEPKETYSWATYKWCDGTDANMTKYNKTDGKTTLELADDAAHVIWGDRWRMPTKAEIQELFDKCTWEADTVHGMSGKRVTGPNGNSIFIPTTGYYNDDHGTGIQGLRTIAYLWTSSTPGNANAYDLLLYHSTLSDGVNSNTRRVGMPIRPVYDENMVTLTINCTPEDAEVGFFYKEGFHVHGNSVMVKKGSSPLYQVTATEKGYLSFGDTLHNITRDTTLNITLRPFSEGTWVKVDTCEYKRVDTYYVSRNGGYAGPYNNWSYFYAPALPGETYRVRAHAGQLAAIWYAASNAPDQAAGIRPKKVACSKNGGITRYIAEEFTIPEGANHLIINASGQGKNLIIERLVPDPCMVVPINDTLSINMMCVEGGTFRMGAMDNDEKAKDDEKPAHNVTLSYDYHIMQTEVTQGLWEAVMGEDIYVAKTNMENAPKPAYVGADYPMYYVRMNDALEFIDKLNAMTGMHFRLPTEAEWEYAARGGNKSKGYLYVGSNNADDVGWYTGRGGLHRVAQLKPNELGIYDMSGNVSEMCLDYGTYGETYKAGDAVNPRGNIRSNGNRFWRGGCYTHSKDSMRVSQRSSYTPSWGGTWLGLRLVLAEENDFRTIRVGSSYFDMSFVKGGTFMMGSDAPDAQADEQPVHEVTLSDYYIGQTEVTQHLWKKVMGDENNPSATKGNNLPVTNITWDEAQQFVERLSELTGMHFRLPTEAEWEYAARGGQKSKGYTYAGSNDIDEVGWYNGNSSNKTHAVGQKQPNELGIYDMTGNVWEYCSDWHMPYSAQAQTNPTGAATGEKHVLRGGCYHYDSKNCTNTNRHSYYTPDNGGASTGLRIVLEVEK